MDVWKDAVVVVGGIGLPQSYRIVRDIHPSNILTYKYCDPPN